MILPPAHRDTKTFLTGNVPPRGMFCMLGSAPDKRPVDVRCCNSLTCSLPSCFVLVAMPPTKLDRYVSTADNLRTSNRKRAASVMPLDIAIRSKNSRLSLPVPKPLALTHLALGATKRRPATLFVSS